MNILVLLLAAATGTPEAAQFEALASKYVQDLFDRHPEAATHTGEHRNDARLDDYSRAGVDRDLAANRDYLQQLQHLQVELLPPEDSVDARILRNRLEAQIYALSVLREWEWNPMRYNPGDALYQLVARDFAPPEQRLKAAIGRLDGVPAVMAAARANLKNPPRVHTETAIAQLKGTIALISTGQLEQLAKSVPALEGEFRPAQKKAVASLQEEVEWMQKELLPNAKGEFRIGAEKFRQKLRYALDSDLSPEQILARAQSDLEATQRTMRATALELWPRLFPGREPPADAHALIKAVLDERAKHHPDNDTVIATATRDLGEATAFVKAHGFVAVPDEPIEVTPWPEFSRGVAVASCNPPGVLEKGQKTFYFISPTPADWSAQRVESFFRENDDDMLRDITVHEAMPGHFLQLAWSNRFRAPTLLRGVGFSGTFVEGWAVYAEQLMAEAGYGGPEVRMQQLKMRLRMIINAIIDQKIHTAGMSEEAAKALMMVEGFQEEGEAVGKWKRAQLTSTQLSTYFVGNAEVNDIRAAWEKKHPGRSLRELHDQMLAHGSPAPKYVKELLGL